MKSCVIIFPLYQAPTKIELAFLENGYQLTQTHKQVIVAPEGLAIDERFGMLQQLEVKRFSKHYFEGISGYNQLLLSKSFFQTFQLFDYLLIHQADVFLFHDNLQEWCEKDFDYIGAPWLRPNKLKESYIQKLISTLKLTFKRNKLYAKRANRVGNGGLSLRKISTALKVLNLVKESQLKPYLNSEGAAYNEDIFWSLEAPLLLPEYRIPPLMEALKFAVEFAPQSALKLLNEELPFGCHAPLKHDPEFWKTHIKPLQ